MVPRILRCVVTAAALALVVAGCSRTEQALTPEPTPAPQAPGAGAGPAAQATPGLLQRKPRQGPVDLAGATTRYRKEALLDAYRCRTRDCEGESFAARNDAEAAWLSARGFPTAARLEELEAMPLGALQLAADRSDLAAQAVLGRRLVERGDHGRGLGLLSQAAARGSVFADYQASLALRDSNIYESAAYLRRAYLQGDSKAALAMYRAFEGFNVAEWANVDRRAMRLYAALLQQRAGQGTFRYGPRP